MNRKEGKSFARHHKPSYIHLGNEPFTQACLIGSKGLKYVKINQHSPNVSKDHDSKEQSLVPITI